MKSIRGRERRDPYSPVLQLGTVLARVRQGRESGWIEVRDQGRVHRVRVTRGAIADVLLTGDESGAPDPGREDRHVETQAARLFGLPRPHSVWVPVERFPSDRTAVDPLAVVLSGVTSRTDLFDPVKLVQRVPADTLCVRPARLSRLLRDVALSQAELDFLSRLERPTPIPMILWKRGLDPRHAGAMLVALNLTGFWGEQWHPGLLPRVRELAQLARRLHDRVGDHELLGLDADAEPREIDRAFRRLSLVIHPDRLGPLGGTDGAIAREAFLGVSAAYNRLRAKSRRSRPVRGQGRAVAVRESAQSSTGWAELLVEAQEARARGDRRRARMFAVKALASSPPPTASHELRSFLSQPA